MEYLSNIVISRYQFSHVVSIQLMSTYTNFEHRHSSTLLDCHDLSNNQPGYPIDPCVYNARCWPERVQLPLVVYYRVLFAAEGCLAMNDTSLSSLDYGIESRDDSLLP